MKTAVPVDGRFEHIVLSCNATMDHAIIWIEREAQKALDVRNRILPTFVSVDYNLQACSTGVFTSHCG